MLDADGAPRKREAVVETTLTPSRLWKRLSPEQRLRIAKALWLDEHAAGDQLQAVQLISQQKKFRPKTVNALDDDQKARHLASLGSLPDHLAVAALIAYHLAEQRPMMSAFLDALGIAHENGLIQDERITPDPAKVGPAVAQLTQQFPAESVSLYVDTLLCQDPETWGVLSGARERLA